MNLSIPFFSTASAASAAPVGAAGSSPSAADGGPFAMLLENVGSGGLPSGENCQSGIPGDVAGEKTATAVLPTPVTLACAAGESTEPAASASDADVPMETPCAEDSASDGVAVLLVPICIRRLNLSRTSLATAGTDSLSGVSEAARMTTAAPATGQATRTGALSASRAAVSLLAGAVDEVAELAPTDPAQDSSTTATDTAPASSEAREGESRHSAPSSAADKKNAEDVVADASSACAPLAATQILAFAVLPENASSAAQQTPSNDVEGDDSDVSDGVSTARSTGYPAATAVRTFSGRAAQSPSSRTVASDSHATDPASSEPNPRFSDASAADASETGTRTISSEAVAADVAGDSAAASWTADLDSAVVPDDRSVAIESSATTQASEPSETEERVYPSLSRPSSSLASEPSENEGRLYTADFQGGSGRTVDKGWAQSADLRVEGTISEPTDSDGVSTSSAESLPAAVAADRTEVRSRLLEDAAADISGESMDEEEASDVLAGERQAVSNTFTQSKASRPTAGAVRMAGAVRASGSENIAAPATGLGAMGQFGERESENKNLSPTGGMISDSGAFVGTDVANSRVAMSASTLERRTRALREQESPSSDGVSAAEVTTPQSFSLASFADPVATARQTVDAVIEFIEAHTARVQDGTQGVSLEFDIDGKGLSVRIDLRGDEVHTRFRTDSSELQGALAHEWHSVPEQTTNRSLRLLEPTFGSTTAGNDGSWSSRSDDSASRQNSQSQQQDEAFASAGSPRRSVAVSSTSQTDRAVAAPPSPNSLHLATFA